MFANTQEPFVLSTNKYISRSKGNRNHFRDGLALEIAS